MSDLVPADEIEQIVGRERHPTRHYAKAVTAEQVVYILHSQTCLDSRPDPRTCPFSIALDAGIDLAFWSGVEDQLVRVTIVSEQRLAPVSLR